MITGLSLGCLYFFIFPIFIFLIRGDLSIVEGLKPQYSQLVIGDESLAVVFRMTSLIFIFQLLIFVVQQFFARVIELNKSISPPQVSWKRLKVVIFILILFYLFFITFVLKQADHWYEARAVFLNKFGQIAVFYIFCLFSLKMILLSDLFNVFEAHFKSGKTIFFIATVAMLAELVITGNRISLLLCFVLFGWACLVRKSFGLLISWIFLGGFLGVLLAGYGIFRSLQHRLGLAAAWSALISQLTEVGDLFYFSISGIFETVNINVLYSITRLESMSELSLTKLTFIKPFLAPIPRSIMPYKIETITELIGQVYASTKGVSLVTLIYGEGYYNFGIFYPIFILPFVLMLIFLLRLGSRYSEYRYLSLLVGFLIVRFPFSDVVIQTSVAIFIGFLVKRINLAITKV